MALHDEVSYFPCGLSKGLKQSETPPLLPGSWLCCYFLFVSTDSKSSLSFLKEMTGISCSQSGPTCCLSLQHLGLLCYLSRNVPIFESLTKEFEQTVKRKIAEHIRCCIYEERVGMGRKFFFLDR